MKFSLDGMIHVFLSKRDRGVDRTFLPGFAIPASVLVSTILVRPGIAANIDSVESMAAATDEGRDLAVRNVIERVKVLHHDNVLTRPRGREVVCV